MKYTKIQEEEMINILWEKGIELTISAGDVYMEKLKTEEVPKETMAMLHLGFMAGLTLSTQFDDSIIEKTMNRITATLNECNTK